MFPGRKHMAPSIWVTGRECNKYATKQLHGQGMDPRASDKRSFWSPLA